MVLTREQKTEYMKLWREENRDKIKVYAKKYRENNIEHIRKRSAKYRQDNKEYYAEYKNIYNKSPSGKKSYILSSWKARGLNCNDYDALYNQYLNVTNCDACGCLFGKYGDGSGTHKCMDHDHVSGVFRNFLCCKCNVKLG